MLLNRRSIVVALFAVALSACGGGSDDSGSPASVPAPPAQQPPPASVPPSGTGTAALSWDVVTTNADASPLPTPSDLAGYRIYYGTASGTYGTPVSVGSTATAHTVTGLASGTWYFVVSAFDDSGNESALSDEVRKVVP